MSKQKESAAAARRIIIQNRKAHHDYFIETRLEAGMVLLGWEVKALRAGRANLNDSYVIVKDAEVYLLGLHISPLPTTAAYLHPDPIRTRKLLLHQREIQQLIGSVQLKGYTLIPLDLYWHQGRAKCAIALARGKKQHDKRADDKQRDWSRERNRLLKHQQ